MSLRREIPNTCRELAAKRVDLIVILSDGDGQNWRDVCREVSQTCPSEYQHLAVFGVCDRNIECWLCGDPTWIAQRTGRPVADYAINDPKGVFESALKIISSDRKEHEIAEIVSTAPLHHWLSNRSFEDFYDKIWAASIQNGCSIENLRDQASRGP